MKIWCDVCSSKEASVFCSADEASLCLDCDPKVHQANKLASKHQRFSLLKPTSSDFPVCDICQEKKALLFCQQDRAILCRDCDISIHAANEHTQKHNRYLLTGIKLSPSSTSNLPQTLATASTCTNTNQMSKDGSGGSSSNNSSGFDQVPDFKSEKSNSTKKIVPSYSSSANYSEISSTLTNEINNKSLRPAPNVMSTTASKDGSITQLISSSGGGGNISDGSTTSSISEYLMEMLPGWQVEDLLQDSSSIPFTYSKMQDNNLLGIDLLPNKDDERDRSFENNMGVWVPQAPSPLLPLQPSTPFSTNIAFGMNHGLIQNHHQTAKGENNKKPSSRKKMTVNNNAHDGFMVPQISPQFFSGSNKRYRPFY